MITLSTATLLTISSGGILRPFSGFSNNQKFGVWKCYTQSNKFIGYVHGNNSDITIITPMTASEAIDECSRIFQECMDNECTVKPFL